MNRHAENSASVQQARLRLTRGLSMHVSWILRSGRSSPITTIGTSRSCDWQIHAAGVAPHALSIAFIAGVLHAAAGPDAYVTVNGHSLSEAWHTLTGPFVIRLGEARLELGWDDLGLADEERERATWPDGQPNSAKRHPPGGDAGLPNLLETEAESGTSVSLLRVTGFAFFAAIAYCAWLVLLDHV